jgi:hypothetical protein
MEMWVAPVIPIGAVLATESHPTGYLSSANVVPMAHRLSQLGTHVVSDIAARLDVEPKVVLRAMLSVALHHQGELRKAIEQYKDLDFTEW